MYTFLISVVALVLGYIFYGKFVDKVFCPDAGLATPAYAKSDGVDFVPMSGWKVFMVQFLNIAGTGPIFGAIMGARFGPSCYLWIVFGCIFGGAVHDYFSGMLSVRHGGANLPDLVGIYLGGKAKAVALFFSVVMLLLVGAVFIYSSALILGELCGGTVIATILWVFAIILYFILATLVPVDKIIGRIYPIFAIALVFMAFALMTCLFAKWPSGIPEIWDGLHNRTPQNGSIFPCLFISIACGAVSGFHGTQSPLMARCIMSEKQGRRIFYGSMVLEGVVALIWATVASYFFFAGGNEDMGAVGVNAAPSVVNVVSRQWLGTLGSILAILGVVAAPITSGDTALRSARIITADALHIRQDTMHQRVTLSIPIFVLTGAILCFNIIDSQGFDLIWRYFGWANQTLAAITLWAVTAFLVKSRKGAYYLISLIPSCVMTSVCITFICTSKIGFNIPESAIPYIGTASFLLPGILFFILKSRRARLEKA